MHQNFDATSSSSFLDYVQQMESFDPSDENALKSQFDDEQPFTSLPPETKQCPWKDMHYKRSLSQYIKKKYQRSVKVTNKFAEKTYREFYHHRITENPRISRYLKVFFHPDITQSDFGYIQTCEKKMIRNVVLSQVFLLGGIGYAYFKTDMGKKMKKNLGFGIGIGMLPFISMILIKLSHPVVMDWRMNRNGLYKKYAINI